MARSAISSEDGYNTDDERLHPSAAQEAPPTREEELRLNGIRAKRFILQLLDSNPKELAKSLMAGGNLDFLPSLEDAELLKRVFDTLKKQQREFSLQHPDSRESFPSVKELLRHNNFRLLRHHNPTSNFLKTIFPELKEAQELQEAMRKTNFSALALISEAGRDLGLVKMILAEFTPAEQRAFVRNHINFIPILRSGATEVFKEWVNIAAQLGCLDEMMEGQNYFFNIEAIHGDRELARKLIPAFMGLRQQAEVCLRYSNEQNASAVFQEIWRHIPPNQRREIISHNNYQLFAEIAGTNDVKLLRDFLQIAEESGQKERILSLDAIDINTPIYRALKTAVEKNAAKSFKTLFSQLNPEQKRALFRIQQDDFSDLLYTIITQEGCDAAIISDLFRCMSPTEKAQSLHDAPRLFQQIALIGNFSLISHVLNVTDFNGGVISFAGGSAFESYEMNAMIDSFERCAGLLRLPPAQDREYAKGAPLDFAREIMRRTIVAITNAIIPDNDEDSALTDEAKALRKYQAHAAEAGHATSLIRCATRKMGALVMDNLQQFREARDISIALEQAFRNPSDALPTNQDVGRLIAEAAMPHLEKIVPADVMQLADFIPAVTASSPEALAADIAKANEVMQKIYRGIKSEIFAASEKEPAASVVPAAAAAAAAALAQNPSNSAEK